MAPDTAAKPTVYVVIESEWKSGDVDLAQRDHGCWAGGASPSHSPRRAVLTGLADAGYRVVKPALTPVDEP